MNSVVECPLCTQIGFQSVDALRIALVSAASRNLKCPVCNESLTGLDKLTVHLFGHTLPQHALQSVYLPNRTNNNIPHINTANQGSVLEPLRVIPQEPKKKVEVTHLNAVPLQGFESFQPNSTSTNKLSGSASISNQDLSNLLCWLPVTCLPEKLPNSTVGNIGPVSSDIHPSAARVQSQQNDGKGESRQLLSTVENNILNKDTSFIVMSLPFLQDVKKQSDLREISNNINIIANELNLSDVSNLSGKLLMLDCSGNSQSTSSVSVNNLCEPSSAQITALSAQQNDAQAPAIDVHPSNQKFCISSEGSNSAAPCTKDDSIEQNNQSSEGRTTESSCQVFRCNLCCLQFTDSNILTLHQHLIHRGSNAPLARLTDSTKDSQSKLDERSSENKEEECFQCHLCSKTFCMQGSLMVHLRVAHTSPSVVGLASRIKENCLDPPSVSTPSVATSKIAKDQSQSKSNDNKQWECSDCGKFFTTKYFLKKHKRLHTGEMPYSCPTCNKSFTFQQSYHKHLLYHSDEKPHTCTECGRSFKELSTLHNHQRIHTGEKPWACETCGKCFRQRVSYLVHRRIHTGVMPYCCTVCKKSFRYKVSQRTHKCVAQPADVSTSQSGSLLERLLFEQTEENQVKRGENVQDKTPEQTSFIQQKQLEKIHSAPVLPQSAVIQSKQQTSEQESQLLFNDKTGFQQPLEPSTSNYNLQNFQLQQTLSDIQSHALSQNNIVLQNISVSLKDDPKQSDKTRNSSWCPNEGSAPGQNLNSSSLVVLVSGKEMISAGLPNTSDPVSLLQVLQKQKYIHNNEFSINAPSGTGTNNLQSSASCFDTVKVGNNAFAPDFLSMTMSASDQNQNPLTGCGSTNISMGGDPFQWGVSVNQPNQEPNDAIVNNGSASQETMDSLQSLLFGSHPTEL